MMPGLLRTTPLTGAYLAVTVLLHIWPAVPALACGDESGLSCDNDEDDARYLLGQAVSAIKTNEKEALAWFTAQSHGFRTQDLYVFCIGPDNVMDSHPDPRIRGTDAETLIDIRGFRFGDRMIHTAKPGQISEITYMWPRLDDGKTSIKHTLYTRVSDQICAVGSYE